MAAGETTGEKHQGKVRNWDLIKAMFYWIWFSAACWSWERMQNVAWAGHLLPLLKRFYPESEDLRAALKRHLVFYNSEPNLSLFVTGTIIAMEEKRSSGDQGITDEAISAVKIGLMAPLAAIGDSLIAGTANAILLTIAMGMALQGNLLAPLFFIVSWIAFILIVDMNLIRSGYRAGYGMSDMGLLASERIKQLTEFMTVLGMTMVGALLASFVKMDVVISWSFQGTTTSLQSILDNLTPKLLPFLLIALLWYLYQFKNWSILKLLGLTILIGVVGTLIRVF
jgi:mannose/fructose/N-acetylgalactosamine-specific phosphotransferase system component IID